MPVLSPERHTYSEQHSQLYEDISTGLAEALNGQMYSSYDFTFDGTDLIAEDGRPMTPILEKSIKTAEIAALLNPLLVPEIERRQVEMEEFQTILAMARGEGPNTLVAIWEIPDYVLQHGGDVGGYRYDLKRAMMRIAHRLPNGKVRIQSQTLDSGFRPGYESFYDALDQPSPEDQPLYRQPIQLDLDEERASSLSNELRDRYDHALLLATGIVHTAGRTKHPVQNTLIFVKQQTDLLDAFTNKFAHLHMNDIPEDEMYNLAAAMQRRMEGRQYVAIDVSDEMGGAGAAARDSGETYSYCGFTLSSGKTAERQLGQLGYGGLIRVMSCGVCGGRALGVECGNAKCYEKDCGSELINGRVINNQKSSNRQKAIAKSIWDILFGRKV